jgi:hypothetical protein
MIARREFLLSCLAAPLAPALAYFPSCSANGRLGFNILRNGSIIGSHTLEFSPQGNGFDIAIAVDIAVRFGPIPLFRYSLHGIEQWRDGTVAHVEAVTDDNGEPDSMRCDRDSAGLWVSGAKIDRYLAPPHALPATHWNMAELKGPWINFQNGRLLTPKVTQLDVEPIRRADGDSFEARHYALSGGVDLDLWYDSAGEWSGMRFAAKDGSIIRYERL